MLTGADTILYEATPPPYNCRVVERFTIGDVIRKARQAKRWSQTKLGVEAARFQLSEGTQQKINKSTVSKVEKDPYTSELGTVWRLLATLNLTFSDVESRLGIPFTRSPGEGAAMPKLKRRQAG